MLYPRIIPCLLVHDKGLVKTVKFKSYKYVGDPINAVRIFNEKEVDELIVLDIDASARGYEPNYKLIENLATECRMPLCYGGGVKTAEQARRIFNLGVEKIAISSVAVENIGIVSEMSAQVGAQSVVVVLDVKKKMFGGYEVVTINGTKKSGINPVPFVSRLCDAGAGEIVINSVDNDGMMQGFDMDLIERIKAEIDIPLTVLGGAGSLEDMGLVVKKHGIIGVSAGSLFVFKGKYKAVLINYLNAQEKAEFIKTYYKD